MTKIFWQQSELNYGNQAKMTSKINVDIRREVGHPTDDRPGFDLMEIKADTESELEKAMHAAKQKFWECWICGINDKTGVPTPTAIMYKPSGIKESWEDSLKDPHPGGNLKPRLR